MPGSLTIRINRLFDEGRNEEHGMHGYIWNTVFDSRDVRAAAGDSYALAAQSTLNSKFQLF
jgi:hypothetical protein